MNSTPEQTEQKPPTMAQLNAHIAWVLELLRTYMASMPTHEAVGEVAKVLREHEARWKERAAGRPKPPEPEPPEAPLGVGDVIDGASGREPVLAISGTIAWTQNTTRDGFPCYGTGYGQEHRVSLADIHAGDVVRDVKHGLCCVAKSTALAASVYFLYTIDGNVLVGWRDRHQMALVARGKLPEVQL